MGYKAKSFTFWVSYYDVAQELSAKEQGEFYKAVADYIFKGIDSEPDLRKNVRIAFKAVKANLKRSVANRREVGHESDGNRGEVPQTENALNLKLKLKPNGGAAPSMAAPAGSAYKCPLCGLELQGTGIDSEPWWCENCSTGFTREKVASC